MSAYEERGERNAQAAEELISAYVYTNTDALKVLDRFAESSTDAERDLAELALELAQRAAVARVCTELSRAGADV